MNSDNLNLAIEANFKIIFDGNKVRTEIGTHIDLSFEERDKIQEILLKAFFRQMGLSEKTIELFTKNREIFKNEKCKEAKEESNGN